jgi:hypothetical protein
MLNWGIFIGWSDYVAGHVLEIKEAIGRVSRSDALVIDLQGRNATLIADWARGANRPTIRMIASSSFRPCNTSMVWAAL